MKPGLDKQNYSVKFEENENIGCSEIVVSASDFQFG